MIRLSATYFKKKVENNEIKQQIGSVLSQDKKFRSISFSEIKKNQDIKKQPSQDYDEELTKRFDHLLSSPRLKLEVSESMGPELSSRGQPKQPQLCLICYEKESNMINQPCGHGGFCQECSQQLLSKSNLCLLCRKPVTHTLIVQGVENRESLVEVIGVLQDAQKYCLNKKKIFVLGDKQILFFFQLQHQIFLNLGNQKNQSSKKNKNQFYIKIIYI